jgi:hypothetical protein
MHNGTLTLAPTSSPSDCEIMENAPPARTRMLVAMELIDSPVQMVIRFASRIMSSPPASPALPTTQPVRRYITAPIMVSSVGKNTPSNVPNLRFSAGTGLPKPGTIRRTTEEVSLNMGAPQRSIKD